MTWAAWLLTVTILADGELERSATRLAPFASARECRAFADETNARLRATPGPRSLHSAALVVCTDKEL